MRIACVFLLTAVLTGHVHAECSGGDGGGTDATGNQCSAPNDIAGSGLITLTQALSDLRASIRSPAPLLRVTNVQARSNVPTLTVAPVDRIVRVALPSAPMKASKVENWSETSCSGGSGGGMDVNGNQCDPAQGGIVAAK